MLFWSAELFIKKEGWYVLEIASLSGMEIEGLGFMRVIIVNLF